MESLWVLRREQVDPTCFSSGHIGPFLIGHTVRATVLGEVVVALHRSYETVVEIERFASLRDTALAGPDCAILSDLAHVTGLRHRYIAPIVGAGMDGGAPYVVRPHQLGRTLAAVQARVSIDRELAGAILHAVAEGLEWLSEQGPSPGTCSMGGLDESDVFLGFDGEVRLLGIGTKLARAPEVDPIDADLTALLRLAERLGVHTIATARSAGEAAAALRRAHRAGCGERTARIGSLLRVQFESDMHQERAMFGLPQLH